MNNYVRNEAQPEVKNIKTYPNSKSQTTIGKLVTLVIALSIAGYGLFQLNKWFTKTTHNMVDNNRGRVPVLKYSSEDPIDSSWKIPLYAADGKSGLFDILNRNKNKVEEYEMYGIDSPSKKMEDESFYSNYSRKTTVDIEFGFSERRNSSYELSRTKKNKLGLLSGLFDHQESLL